MSAPVDMEVEAPSQTASVAAVDTPATTKITEKTKDGQEVSIEVQGDKVTVNGEEAVARDVHCDAERFESCVKMPGFVGGAKNLTIIKGADGKVEILNNVAAADEDSDSGVECEETIEECFVNDARFGEFEDIKQSYSENPELLNAQNDTGSTALMMAATNNHLEIVTFLLGCAGVDVDKANSSGNTALHWAALTGRKQVCELLLTKGANADILNEAGKKPFDEAQGKGYTGVCEVLAPKTDFTYCSPEPDEETDKKHRIGGA